MMHHLNKENGINVLVSSITQFFTVSGIREFDKSYLVWQLLGS